MGATLASVSLGFLREVVNAHNYGTHFEMDAFLAAAVIPTILFGVFNGALVSALIPVFTEYIAQGNDEEAWRLGSTVINSLLVVMTLLAFAGWWLAPSFVPIVARGFSAERMQLAIELTRWLMPSIVATSIAGVVSAMLNAGHRFAATALQGIAVNIVTIATVLLLSGRLHIFALALGTTLGLFAQLLVQLPSLRKRRMYRPVIDLRHPGLAKVWLMLGPIVIGSTAGQTAIFFDRYFASMLPAGYMSGMNYSMKLVGFPQQIFAAAIATVIFPLLATHFASENRGAVRRSLVMGLRMVNFITIPAMCGLIVLRVPIVATLFQRGAFQQSATDLCAGLLPFAAAALVPLAGSIVLTRCAFACKETRATVIISVSTVLVNIALSILWLQPLGARGLLLANACSQFVQCALLFALVSRMVGAIDLRAIARSGLLVTLCSSVMVGVLTWISSLHVAVAPTLGARALYLGAQLAIAGLVFIAMSYMLRVEEPSLAVGLLTEKFKRRIPGPAEAREAPIA
jgi:putative peptidoglycan lipid II flippase